MRPALLAAALAVAALAADPPKLHYDGKPMRVEAQCSEDDVQALGLTCSTESPCPLYLELSAIESTGPRIFLTGNIHTDSATLWSILLASEDGGQSWSEPVERIRSAGLDQIQFYDLATGWISGQLLQSTPRDPFLLLTTDGGKNWRKRNVYPESRPGSIDSFWFESGSKGLMALDRIQTEGEGGRYEVYESMTGGESWSIREVGRKPIPLKKPALDPDSRGWRVHPNAKTKAFEIEKRQGERWLPIASFLVSAGTCKPLERTETVSPPEPQPDAPEQPAAPAPRKTPTLRKKGRAFRYHEVSLRRRLEHRDCDPNIGACACSRA